MAEFFFRVWGARGSIPISGKDVVRYGGSTSCLEVRCNNQLLIFDCGSGMRQCGNHLLREMPLHAHILFTHVHWDHIQGFPFFKPAYIKGNHFHIYGNKSFDLRHILSQQMSHPNFPVSLENMSAEFEFTTLEDKGLFSIDQITILYDQLNHPDASTCFRVNYKNKSLVYATDTEHTDKPNEMLIEFSKGADIFIYDSQYTSEEYSGRDGVLRKGWGHSTWDEGVKLAKSAGVKTLILWHHDPDHSDDVVREIELNAQGQFAESYAAYEGMTVDLL